MNHSKPFATENITPPIEATANLTRDDSKCTDTQDSLKSLISSPSETKIDSQPTVEQSSEEELLKEVIQLSKQQAAEDEARRKAREEWELEEALRLSKSFQNGSNVVDLSDPAPSRNEVEFQSYDNFFKELTREEFDQCLNDFFKQQVEDGIERIEKGSLVRMGNGQKDFKQGVAAHDNGNQERAQYGRLSTDALYYIIDSLTGVHTRVGPPYAVGDSSGLPDEAVGPIQAFMDIGSGKLLNNVWFQQQ